MHQRFASQYLQGSPRSAPSQRVYQNGKGYEGKGRPVLDFILQKIGNGAVYIVVSNSGGF